MFPIADALDFRADQSVPIFRRSARHSHGGELLGLHPSDDLANARPPWRCPLRVVADAYFSKAPFVNPLLDAGVDFVSKLRCDAVGWDDPTPDQRSDAKRGKKWKLVHLLDHFPAQILTVHLYGETVEVRAVSRILQLRNFTHKVKVVVTEGAKGPVILMSTDLSLSAAQIIEIYEPDTVLNWQFGI